jgi:hypothetical protein
MYQLDSVKMTQSVCFSELLATIYQIMCCNNTEYHYTYHLDNLMYHQTSEM